MTHASDSSTPYEAFLSGKRLVVANSGIDVPADAIASHLFPFQRDLTRWALRKGRAAIFADTGLGKTRMQLEWGQRVTAHTGGRALILAPLAVAHQTVAEGAAVGIPVTYARKQADAAPTGITIANYEMLFHFEPSAFDAIILDESSILKSFDGKLRSALIAAFAATPYRLCCTATPAPNDIAELANHAEFLGIMSRVEMLSAFFVHDDAGWRLKGHARDAFYRWLASWGMSIKRPSDLGYSDAGYDLPGLAIERTILPTTYVPAGRLFADQLRGITDRSAVRKQTLPERVRAAAGLINASPDEPWIAWVGLNDEGRELAALIPDAVLVEGSQSPEVKSDALRRFVAGGVRVLITKVAIAGFGLNFQHCARMVFVGMGDSYEQYYQAIRRCYRFGQARRVVAHIVLTEPEEVIYGNVMRKEDEAERTGRELVKHVAEYERQEIGAVVHNQGEYREDGATGDGWRLLLGDSAERLAELPSDSIDLSVYSPPFASLYTYSPTERDLGNCANEQEFFAHYGYITEQILRVTKPGRITAVHVADTPAMLARDGYIGLKDFSGDVIRHYVAHGWIFDSRIPIDKNQQAQSIRTHAKGLTMTQMEKDRTWSRPALPDYILKFRKPGENTVPVKDGDITRDLWIEYANPTWPNEDDRCAEGGAFATWYGIRETDTLQAAAARSEEDERHICPLQLETISRCIRLWSNAGETVLSPFAGIGSEGYQAIKHGRRFVGVELKPEYWRVAVNNLTRAQREAHAPTLFDLMPAGSL